MFCCVILNQLSILLSKLQSVTLLLQIKKGRKLFEPDYHNYLLACYLF